MIYKIDDNPPIAKTFIFAIQMVLSVFVASVLIANICGVATSGALFGAGLSTFVYLLVTGFKSPMFISNSGAMVAPVLAAMAIGGYTGIAISGLTTCIVYCVFGYIFSKVDVSNIYKIFPKSLIGAVTIVIGITLMSFIGTYVQVNGNPSKWGVVIALFTAFVISVVSHYTKGLAKILPFLIGTLVGYTVCALLTVTGICKMIDFSVFKGMKLLSTSDTAFKHWTGIGIEQIVAICISTAPYSLSAMMECLSDHAALGSIVETDLYKTPGLSRIFIGEGLANIVGTVFGGLGQCSYGEGVACVGFSKVASSTVTLFAAVIMMMLSFINPVQVFIASIPSCVFGGCAIILYSFIASSGIKMLQNVDLNNNKNLLIVSVALSTGISGIALGTDKFSLTGTALALVLGVVLNLVLKEEKPNNSEEI